MAKYPDRRSAAIPALHAAQEVHGWCSPEAIDQVAAVMQLTPAYLTSVATFYDMLETHPQAAQRRVRVHEHLVLAARRRRVLRGDDRGRAGGRRRQRALVRVPRRVRHRADGVGQRRVRRPARARRRGADRRGPARRPAGARAKQLRYRRCADPGVAEGAPDFSPPPAEVPRADTAGLGPEGDTVDRPGPTAPIEIPRDEAEAED